MPLPRRLLAALVCGALAPASLAGAGTAAEDPLAAQAAVRPVVAEAEPPLVDVERGLLPDAEAVTEAIADEVVDPRLGQAEHVAVVVRDVVTGRVLHAQHENPGFTPASVTKLLTAAAVALTLPMEEPFATRAVGAPGTGVVHLVAGGDALLAPGPGQPGAVAGRAGLSDLAEQVIAQLEALPAQERPAQVTVRLDLGHAPGPAAPQGWTDFWLGFGYAGPVTMLGLAGDRARPGDPAPAEPAQEAARAFARALQERGVRVAGEPGEDVDVAPAPAGAPVLGEVRSAPAREVLQLALAESDNMLIEQLARQGAAHEGAGTAPSEVAAWVLDRLARAGLDVGGVELADVSGLADGTRLPAGVVTEILVAGADGSYPQVQGVLAGLPVAGLSGTLWDRFHLDAHQPTVGLARAKTGSLPDITTLAGYVVTADDRLLAYTVIADRLRGRNPVEARSAVDEIVAELARCGC